MRKRLEQQQKELDDKRDGFHKEQAQWQEQEEERRRSIEWVKEHTVTHPTILHPAFMHSISILMQVHKLHDCPLFSDLLFFFRTLKKEKKKGLF